MKINKGLIAIFILTILTAVSATTALAQDKVDCTMCHTDKAEGKVVHPAVSFGCDSCHTGVDASDIPHKFTGPKGLSKKGNSLCMTCHDEGKFNKKSRHAALESGCITCHDPHVNENRKLLVSPQPELCKGCHGKKRFEKKTRHEAINTGCTPCHSPHSADFDKLLKDKTPDLCYICHDQALYYGPTIHSPVGKGECLSCHVPHSTDNDTLTKKPSAKLCFSCHPESGFKGKGSTHKPVMEGLCLECHLPHISNNEGLLFRQGNLICRKCHPQIEKQPHTVAGFTSPGHPVRGRKDLGRPGKIHSCLSCHKPHESDSPNLFRYKGTTAFDLCQNCHKGLY